ncbi:hypothetical protein HK096_008197, partial [Nowakowskiella sp. JEL0078]
MAHKIINPIEEIYVADDNLDSVCTRCCDDFKNYSQNTEEKESKKTIRNQSGVNRFYNKRLD